MSRQEEIRGENEDSIFIGADGGVIILYDMGKYPVMTRNILKQAI